MRKLGLDVERKAVQRYPVPHPNADGGDLVLELVAPIACTFVRPRHPDADPVVAALAAHVEGRERANEPFLDRGDEAAQVGRPALEIEHDIADALAGPMIGELAAAAGHVDRKARLD